MEVGLKVIRFYYVVTGHGDPNSTRGLSSVCSFTYSLFPLHVNLCILMKKIDLDR